MPIHVGESRSVAMTAMLILDSMEVNMVVVSTVTCVKVPTLITREHENGENSGSASYLPYGTFPSYHT